MPDASETSEWTICHQKLLRKQPVIKVHVGDEQQRLYFAGSKGNPDIDLSTVEDWIEQRNNRDRPDFDAYVHPQ